MLDQPWLNGSPRFLRKDLILQSLVMNSRNLSIYCINGGVPQGSKIGPVAFVVHINNLPEAINEALKIRPPCEWENDDYVVIDDNSILFMDDGTMFEVIDFHTHISGTIIGYTQEKIDAVKVYSDRK